MALSVEKDKDGVLLAKYGDKVIASILKVNANVAYDISTGLLLWRGSIYAQVAMYLDSSDLECLLVDEKGYLWKSDMKKSFLKTGSRATAIKLKEEAFIIDDQEVNFTKILEHSLKIEKTPLMFPFMVSPSLAFVLHVVKPLDGFQPVETCACGSTSQDFLLLPPEVRFCRRCNLAWRPKKFVDNYAAFRSNFVKYITEANNKLLKEV